eukprot:5704301-Pleurochrysis_carterae.AAC.1
MSTFARCAFDCVVVATGRTDRLQLQRMRVLTVIMENRGGRRQVLLRRDGASRRIRLVYVRRRRGGRFGVNVGVVLAVWDCGLVFDVRVHGVGVLVSIGVGKLKAWMAGGRLCAQHGAGAGLPRWAHRLAPIGAETRRGARDPAAVHA